MCISSPPHSQKRSIKSVERSYNWLLHLLEPEGRPSNLFAHMAGGSVAQARASFASSLLAPLDEKEQLQVPDLKNLDEGVTGYSFDLVPLKYSLPSETDTDEIPHLLKSSLKALSDTKPRIINGATSPYEVLRLVREVGIDVFDVQWAFDAAQWGVAFDFTFPARLCSSEGSHQRRIGHNLYDNKYTVDAVPLADEFCAGTNREEGDKPVCSCIACSPVFETEPIDHSPLATEMLKQRGIKVDVAYIRGIP